jgi:hypothetical protein
VSRLPDAARGIKPPFCLKPAENIAISILQIFGLLESKRPFFFEKVKKQKQSLHCRPLVQSSKRTSIVQCRIMLYFLI